MKKLPQVVMLLSSISMGLSAPMAGAVSASEAAPQMVVYQNGLALVNDNLTVSLRRGINEVIPADLLPGIMADSVVLDPVAGTSQARLQMQLQSPSALSEVGLLKQFEGKTLQFQLPGDNLNRQLSAKVVHVDVAESQVLLDIDGKLRFGLPGTPMFPVAETQLSLSQAPSWRIFSERAQRGEFDLSYLATGVDWSISYNAVLLQGHDQARLEAWATVSNRSAQALKPMQLVLAAGNVNRNQAFSRGAEIMMMEQASFRAKSRGPELPQAQKQDEYYYYPLSGSYALPANGAVQVKLMESDKVAYQTRYVYDGLYANPGQPRPYGYRQADRSLAQQSFEPVWVMRELDNDSTSGLGRALPAGTIRFYQQDAAGQRQFLGENQIPHTPEGEQLTIYTGDAFDLTGKRHQLSQRHSQKDKSFQESYEVVVKNHSEQAVQVEVREHLLRWPDWEIETSSSRYYKQDANTVSWQLKIPAGGEGKVQYQVLYRWQ